MSRTGTGCEKYEVNQQDPVTEVSGEFQDAFSQEVKLNLGYGG